MTPFTLGVAGLAAIALWTLPTANAAPAYRVIGQPNLAGTTLASRCAERPLQFQG
jgi:hypothetical protein